jgi:hypothetical protein
MKCGRKRYQNLAEVIKEYPQKYSTQQKIDNPGKPAESSSTESVRIYFFAQTGGT